MAKGLDKGLPIHPELIPSLNAALAELGVDPDASYVPDRDKLALGSPGSWPFFVVSVTGIARVTVDIAKDDDVFTTSVVVLPWADVREVRVTSSFSGDHDGARQARSIAVHVAEPEVALEVADAEGSGYKELRAFAVALLEARARVASTPDKR
jgi:hypothetical protein